MSHEDYQTLHSDTRRSKRRMLLSRTLTYGDFDREFHYDSPDWAALTGDVPSDQTIRVAQSRGRDDGTITVKFVGHATVSVHTTHSSELKSR